MIKSIQIMNFESHKDTLIKLKPGTNAIIGESENGKSAIIRAIIWVAFNRPSGEEFRSKWGGTTKVTLDISEYRITREKSDKDNCYWIEGVDGYKKKLSGFGQNVPQEVTEILGLLPLNFQTQFDSHFLLPPVSPGEVARKLNEIVDLEIIDTAQANVNANMRGIKRDMASTESSIKNLEEEKKGLSWVRDAGIDLEEMEKAERKLNDVRSREQRLTQLIWEVERVEKETAKLAYVDKAEAALHVILSASEAVEKLAETEKRLSGILGIVTELDVVIDQTQSKLKREEKELEEKFPEVCPLCGQKIK